MNFAKVAEHKLSTEVFRVVKFIDRCPLAVYEIEDLNGTPIDFQFYQDELTPLRITCRTNYNIRKILDNRVRRGIRVYLVRWRG